LTLTPPIGGQKGKAMAKAIDVTEFMEAMSPSDSVYPHVRAAYEEQQQRLRQHWLGEGSGDGGTRDAEATEKELDKIFQQIRSIHNNTSGHVGPDDLRKLRALADRIRQLLGDGNGAIDPKILKAARAIQKTDLLPPSPKSEAALLEQFVEAFAGDM